MKKILFTLLLALPLHLEAQQIVFGNDLVKRTFRRDHEIWRTVSFSNATGGQLLPVYSEEVNLLPMNSEQGYTITDFKSSAKPLLTQHRDTAFLYFSYLPLPGLQGKEAMPDTLKITYYAVRGQLFLRKVITLCYQRPATLDRLEVERLISGQPARGGGRGEPVFVAKQWFLGLEYPAGYSRHTDGNTPAADSRYYEKVGNYSFVDLAGRDIAPEGKKGMIRLMHFPGYAIACPSGYRIISKTAVAGLAIRNQPVDQAFMRYMESIWKAPRSFLHFNNWFEPEAKDLSGEGLVDIWRAFKKEISPYGVHMDAMVADDGWQNRQSIWEPSPQYFPNGYSDVRKLSEKLNREGVGFGLWLSLNSYGNDLDWGKQQGYREALRNPYFRRYGRNYSLSGTKYKAEVLAKIPLIAREIGAIYYKHDFNVLSDLDSGNNHPPDDRHGHEATLDATIEILLATKRMNPSVYQNLTNWIWFSPWWLMYSDYLWMLAGDDGTNGNWPELSTRAMASTDRDTYIWRMFGKPADRPLIPISRLMTHGIIKNSTGMMESPEDNLQDWAEYCLMYYGRGTLLKEWYISPSVMQPAQWKALCTIDGWAKKHRNELNHTIYAGGRPDEGHAYGYMGWSGNRAVLVARNPRADSQTLEIPLDASTGFEGTAAAYKADVVFPYQDEYPGTFMPGKTIRISLPGYATMALEFSPGHARKKANLPAPPEFRISRAGDSTSVALCVPRDNRKRCDLLVTGYPEAPGVRINGLPVVPARSSKALINHFASYASAGMRSKTAKTWTMRSFDLRPYAGQNITINYAKPGAFESYLLCERTDNNRTAIQANDRLWALSNHTRRYTYKLTSPNP